MHFVPPQANRGGTPLSLLLSQVPRAFSSSCDRANPERDIWGLVRGGWQGGAVSYLTSMFLAPTSLSSSCSLVQQQQRQQQQQQQQLLMLMCALHDVASCHVSPLDPPGAEHAQDQSSSDQPCCCSFFFVVPKKSFAHLQNVAVFEWQPNVLAGKQVVLVGVVVKESPHKELEHKHYL